MTCEHTPAYPDIGSCPSMESALACCSIVGSHERLKEHPRAVTVPEGNKTYLDAAFWGNCSQLQRACVVAHERAHVVIGLDCPCESCADKVGGYLMRVWGFTTTAIRDGFRSLNVVRAQPDGTTRVAEDGASAGANAAVRGLAARGLLGEVASRESLLTSKTAPQIEIAAPKTPLESASTILGARTAITVATSDTSKVTGRLTTLQPPTAPRGASAAPKPTDPIRSPLAGPTVKITDPSFVSPTAGAGVPASPADAFSSQVKAQVLAGIIVAVIVAVVVGAR